MSKYSKIVEEEEEKNRPTLIWNVLAALSASSALEQPSKIAILTTGEEVMT
jgi:hypothetical protein